MIGLLLSKFAGSVARELVRSLKSDPSAWSPQDGGQYWIRHDSGLRLWVGNGSYGVSVYPPSGQGLWDVTGWCVLGGSPSQHAVWRAYRAWRTERVRALVEGALT